MTEIKEGDSLEGHRAPLAPEQPSERLGTRML
ncbi:hypothetical protein RLEG12_14630 [Rhizobium leguminosarum bv. trifolii CB782]|nr:hypothetical protein RLEG12_14630 [Rhizobium leguminosarum bv. trifolii CB782]